MQPKTAVVFDQASFDRVKTNVAGLLSAARGRRRSVDYAAPIPLDVGVELTTRCNLRCKHCFLWSDFGLYRQSSSFQHRDLSFDVFEMILRETEPRRSNLFFWGTEPLLYPQWEPLCRLLEKDERWTVVCTNGTLIEKRMESLSRISKNLAVVVSLDGRQPVHDEMRGEGAFAVVSRNLEHLRVARARGEFRGLLTLHAVLNEKLVPELYDFCLSSEALGVDSLYIGFPWYIGPTTASRMDEFVAEHLGFLGVSPGPRSWHAYRHRLDPSFVQTLKAQLDRINGRVWKMRLRLQPALEVDELEDFLAGGERTAQKRMECFAVSNRMDVRASGTVTACQCYPELIVGDLNDEGVLDVWRGDRMRRVRRAVAGGLMPVCSKCVLLYLNGR